MKERVACEGGEFANVGGGAGTAEGGVPCHTPLRSFFGYRALASSRSPFNPFVAMAESISKVQRWLDLIAFLAGRRFPVEVDRLMTGVPAYAERWQRGDDTDRASVRRMFERDKDELRELGVPIETVEYRVGWGQDRAEGYRLAREDFYLPYLRLLREGSGKEEPGSDRDPRGRASPRPDTLPSVRLHEEEAGLALDALELVADRPAFPFAEDARAALRKLTFDLDPDTLERTPLLWVDPPGTESLVETLRSLTEALTRRKRVEFTYHGIGRDEITEREVEPWGLLYQHSHWYLLGWDRTREGRRTFRVARIGKVEVNPRKPATPDFAVPEDFDLAELRGRSAWELGGEEPLTARVRFPFPRSLWAERNGVGRLVERASDGAQVRAFDVVQPNPFLRWILSQAGEAEILEPPELVRGFREMARKVVDLYG